MGGGQEKEKKKKANSMRPEMMEKKGQWRLGNGVAVLDVLKLERQHKQMTRHAEREEVVVAFVFTWSKEATNESRAVQSKGFTTTTTTTTVPLPALFKLF